ncbi:TetR family transcriptional regulator [Streptococcus caprae]|uniref:TetR family transcriptional regulator n=1 Tax=Streptococcus caprae TaxID=1640501 RepID=A0ABV8CWV9_9STRE
MLQHEEFEKISVRLICQTANINRSTFYAHFEDKYQLATVVFQEQMKDFMRHHPAATFPFGRDFVWELLVGTRSFIDDIAETWGYGFSSLIPLVQEQLQTDLQTILNFQLRTADLNLTPHQKDWLAKSLSASLFYLIQDSHKRKIDFSSLKNDLLPVIYPTLD